MIRQSSMSINATVQIPQIKMTKVHIPFTFRLETQKDSDEGEQTTLHFHTFFYRQLYIGDDR